MSLALRLSLLLAAALSCTANAAGPPAYRATLLHPLAGYSVSNANNTSGLVQVGDGFGPSTGNQYHALLWTGAAESVVDLTPAGFDFALANAVDGDTQIGHGGGPSTSGEGHALLWHGSAASKVDLHPAAYRYSSAHGIDGNSQVGDGTPDDSQDTHALLWHGDAASVVDLHPAGYRISSARDVQGNTQGGWGYPDGVDLHSRALMWQGTAESVVDLHPATGFAHSRISSIDGNSQVGLGQINLNGGPTHALMWHGTPESVVDLHPAGFSSSVANGVAGSRQVGYGYLAGVDDPHALLWNGTAGSVVDLHQYLAGLPVTLNSSFAGKIGANGMIVGTARDAFKSYAVLWTPIPEPASGAMIASALGMALVGRSRRLHQISQLPATQVAEAGLEPARGLPPTGF